MFKWIGKLFKRRRHTVAIKLYPLQGLGSDRKATLKFVRKWFKKCGNFTATVEDIKTTKTQGHMYIYAKVPASYARKIERLQNKLGIDVEIHFNYAYIGKKESHKVQYYEHKGADWVVTT